MEVPAHLADRPYLQPIYDEPEFIVRNVWRLYGGWWDGNPAALKPPPATALAREWRRWPAARAALAARAVELAESGAVASADRDSGSDLRVAALPGGEDELRLAGHLAELAWLAAPADSEVRQARHRVFSIRADRATSTMSTGVYRWAASEALDDPPA